MLLHFDRNLGGKFASFPILDALLIFHCAKTAIIEKGWLIKKGLEKPIWLFQILKKKFKKSGSNQSKYYETSFVQHV